MHWMRWVVMGVGFILGGWLTFDGMRAFVTGDYVTPKRVPYAGQLGPGSKLVLGVGLDPRSDLVKSMHISLGLAWLIILVCYALRLPWGWMGLIVCSIGSLWYLPFGILIGVAVGGGLIFLHLRGSLI